MRMAPGHSCQLRSPELRDKRGRLRGMVVRSIALVLVICSLVSAPAYGDDEPPYEPPDFMKELPPLPTGVDASAVWRLDLAETLRLAIHEVPTRSPFVVRAMPRL